MNMRRTNAKNGRSGRTPIGNRDNTKKNIIRNAQARVHMRDSISYKKRSKSEAHPLKMPKKGPHIVEGQCKQPRTVTRRGGLAERAGPWRL